MIGFGSAAHRFVGIFVILLILFAYMPSSAQSEDRSLAPRWMGEFYLSLPRDWRVGLEGRDIFFAVGPMTQILGGGKMSADEVKAAVAGMLTLSRTPVPPRTLIDEASGAVPPRWRDGVQLSEAEIQLGESSAILLRLGGTVVPGVETDDGPMDLPIGLAAVLEETPRPDGDYRVIILTGTRPFFDRHPGLIEDIAASFDDRTPPPLERDRAFPYGESLQSLESARLSRPVLANDGFTAIASQRQGTVHLFDSGGQLYQDWDLSAHLGVEDRKLEYLDLDFAADGSLAVLAAYYAEAAEILVFERDGALLSRIGLDNLPRIGQNRVQPRLLRVADDGQYIVVGTPLGQDSRDPVVIDRVSARGELLSRRTPGFEFAASGLQLAVLPGDRLAALKPSAGALNPVGRAVVIDVDGAIIKEWGPDGPSQGAEGHSLPQRFDQLVGADRSGTLFLRYQDILFIYDPDARLVDAFPLPVSGLAQSDELVIDDAGHMLFAAGPRDGLGIEIEQPSFILFHNRRAVALPGSFVLGPDSPDVSADTASAGTALEPQLRELAAAGRLTVRALRAFGALPDGADGLALTLRRQQIDLFAADAMQLERWRDGEGPRLEPAEQRTLEALHRQMTGVLEAASPAEPVGR